MKDILTNNIFDLIDLILTKYNHQTYTKLPFHNWDFLTYYSACFDNIIDVLFEKPALPH